MKPYAWLADHRCPECQNLMPFYKLGANNYSTFQCSDCLTFSRISGHNLLRSLLIQLPVFFGAIALGVWATQQFDALSRFHPTREAYEPNFIGFLVIVFAFIMPALALSSRFTPRRLTKIGDPTAP